MSNYKERPPEHPVDIQRRKDAMKAKAKIVINEMPDKETLTEFVRGIYGTPLVVFDTELGKFIWTGERPTDSDQNGKSS